MPGVQCYRVKNAKRSSAFILVLLLVTVCGCTPKSKTYVIGVVIDVPLFTLVLNGLKAGMADLGHVEGKDVIYVYHGIVDTTPEAIDAEIKKLLAQKVNMLFPTANLSTSRAKLAVKGTGIPIIFGAFSDPVGEGIVESILRPGGNITGVQTGQELPKSLELLVKIIPGAKKFYVPYSASDAISLTILKGLGPVAAQLGVELVPGVVKSGEEAAIAIKKLADDFDGVYCVPSPGVFNRREEMAQAAVERGIPLGSGFPMLGAALINLYSDLFEVGKQTARLVNQVMQGVKPDDMPVETSEAFLSINLKMANAIGLDIPEEILRQATTVIR